MARHTTSRGAATALLVLGLTGAAPAAAAPWPAPALHGGDGAAPGHSESGGQADHGEMDHGEMDHGEMDHGEMDHGEMDHGEHGAGAATQGGGHDQHGAGAGAGAEQQAGGGHDDHGSGAEQGGHGGDPDTVSPQTRQLVLSGFGAANAAVVAGALLLRRRDRRTGRLPQGRLRAQR